MSEKFQSSRRPPATDDTMSDDFGQEAWRQSSLSSFWQNWKHDVAFILGDNPLIPTLPPSHTMHSSKNRGVDN